MQSSFLFGALGGAVTTLAAWVIVSRVIDKQLESGAADLTPQIATAVRQEVPPVVRSELDRTLASYGFTRETGQQVSTILGYADRLGVI